MREQLNKRKPRVEESIEDIEPVDIQTRTEDFSILASPPSADEYAMEVPIVSVPVPAPKKPAGKSKEVYDEESEYAALQALSAQRQEERKRAEGTFPMQSLNLVRELNAVIGSTRFDECVKIPKAASPIRFMGKLKKWGKTIPQYFKLVQAANNNYHVTFTEHGAQQSQIYTALSRINDAEGLLALGRTSHFSAPILPIVCQSMLFEREFDAATEIALRGLYLLQQSLPITFVPGKSKLLASPARREFLDLIAFLARFCYRKECFQTCLSLWKFGLTLTNDDPCDFLLVSAVPALYAGDRKFVEDMLNSDAEWRGVPVKYIPDWSIILALMKAPDELEALAQEVAKWPFIFEDLGMQCDIEVPRFLVSMGSAMRRRIAKYLERPEMESILETAVIIAQDMDMTEELAMALSFWYGVCTDHVEVGDMVEEMVMPTG